MAGYRAEMARARFAEIMDGGSDGFELDEAVLRISAALQPGLDMVESLAAIELLAADCPTPTADGVARHLFDTEHFTGNRGAYYDWRNSCLDRVIATRRGIPITLSVLMIEVGRRVGVPLFGVGMPAHFLVGTADDDDVFYDAFDNGRRLDRDGARRLFDEVTGGQAAWNEQYLAQTPDRDIVIRVLNNLKGVFSGRGDAIRLAIIMDLRSAVAELSELEAAEITSARAIFN